MSVCAQEVRSAFAAMAVVLMLVAIAGFVSLGVDFGRVQLAKAELRTAADAAARAAARGLATSIAHARADALAVAAANTCNGTAVALDSVQDVEFGDWDDAARTFTVDNSTPNAIRVTARRTAARGNAMPLIFARLVGKNTCDVNAVAIAKLTVASPGGIAGLSGVTMKNNAFFGSYRSSVTTNPTAGSAGSNALVTSNGAISGKNNNTLRGNQSLGPSATSSGLGVTGSTVRLSSNFSPTMAAWAPPGGVSARTISSITTLGGGEYWFSSLTINSALSFSGPVTVHVNGNIVVDAAVTAYNGIPANLKIYQYGPSRTFGDVKGNHIDMTAEVVAPGAAFVAKNHATLRGSFIFGSIEFKNSADCFYDEDAGPATGGAKGSTVR